MPKSRESFCPTFEACLIVSRHEVSFHLTANWICKSAISRQISGPSSVWVRQIATCHQDKIWISLETALMVDTKDFSDNSHQNPSCFSQGNGAHSWVFQLVNHAINHFQPTIRAQIHLNSAYNLPLSKHLIIHPKSERQGKATSNWRIFKKPFTANGVFVYYDDYWFPSTNFIM